MTRCICILLAFLTFAVAAPKYGSAFSPSAQSFAMLTALAQPDVSPIDDKGPPRERRIQQFEQGNLGQRKERKGLGAGFWGGPYWGYGPRWGHRCESCRSDCAGDQESAGCKRCRVRCGW
jgi:hypothetical protein